MRVFIDGISTDIEETDFEKYNVIVNKSNGYSHDFQAIEKFDKSKHFYSKYCPFTNRVLNYTPTHLTTKEVNKRIVNSSSLTFS
jgi:hypothetical protein